MYILQKGNQTMAISRNDIHYAIGFKNITSIRHVMYNVDHESPKVHLLKNDNIVIKKHTNSSKNTELSLKYIEHDDFYMYPYKNMMGIIVTNEIDEEDDDYIVLQCHIFDPYFDAELSRAFLDDQFNK
jgi:hypothetical protein